MFITVLTEKNVISINFGVIIISLYLKGFWQKNFKEKKKKESPLPLLPINKYINFLKDRI